MQDRSFIDPLDLFIPVDRHEAVGEIAVGIDHIHKFER